MRYFISGHRNLTKEEFEKHYSSKIKYILRNDDNPHFIVGDWEGCDSMFIDFIKGDIGSCILSIYHVESFPRVTPGNIDSEDRLYEIYGEDYINLVRCKTYDDCDAEMTLDSDFDIAWIRKGREDSHTALNIKRRFKI